MDEISFRPEIPDRLRIAAKQGILIPFVGAGVSKLAGCPSWEEFADASLHFFVKNGTLDYAAFEQLKQLPARTKLSLAVGLQEQHGTDIDFASMLEPRDAEKKKAGIRIYGHLARLARIFITTNYDDWLDLTPALALAAESLEGDAASTSPVTKRTVLFHPSEFSDTALATPHTVFHIHGTVRERKSMILTTSHYLRLYAGHSFEGDRSLENPYLRFLEHLFRVKSVLFIGYGLNELDILEYVIQKARTVALSEATAPRAEPRHYLLQGFYSYQGALMRSLRDYLRRECNVGLLPFLLDQKGWDQLSDVIEYFAETIPVGHLLAAQQRAEMEQLLS